MFHILTNVETIETEKFLVVLAFGNDGYLVDSCCPVYEGEAHAVDFIRKLLATHGQTTATVWTSTQALYMVFLAEPGLGAELKHRDDTIETSNFVKRHSDILIEFHEIEPLVPKPVLPKWRKRLFLWLQKLMNKVGGNGHYEI
jgi:hypothetical protein